MSTLRSPFSKSPRPGSTGAVPSALVFLLALAAVVLSHLTLLHLPYFWDEGGYYVPAALDFYHTGTLIPVFTNAHPPLPSVILGTVWHLFGLGVVVTRITAAFFASIALAAVFSLGRKLLGTGAGVLVALLTAVYPIWFAQSSLAHADIFAAAFSLAALNLYLGHPDPDESPGTASESTRRLLACSALFCLSVLSKETAIVQPLTLCLYEAYLAFRARRRPLTAHWHRRWAFALCLPLPLLAAWFAYHFSKTGHVFGNPVYLRYNATDNFTVAHIAYALRIRFVHLFWQRFMWVPLAIAAACLLIRPRAETLPATVFALSRRVLLPIGLLIGANWIAFSILGGALLTRYLLPMYPLLLLVSVAIWKQCIRSWAIPGLVTALAFIPAIWLNPATFFAPEDNLTYRNMIVVQQEAITYLNQHFPDATVLTAWPVAADLFRPELGYSQRRFRVFAVENFTTPELTKAAQQPGRFDTAVVFTTHYTTPGFRNFLLRNPASWRGRRYAADIDLSPAQIARMLGGTVVWQNDLYGEWAAVIRFDRTYDAQLAPKQLKPLGR